MKENKKAVLHLALIVFLLFANCAITVFYDKINGDIIWGNLPQILYYVSMAVSSLFFYSLLSFSVISAHYRRALAPAVTIPVIALVLSHTFLFISASVVTVSFSSQWKDYLTASILPSLIGGLLLFAAGFIIFLLLLKKKKSFALSSLAAVAAPTVLQLIYEIVFIISFLTDSKKNGISVQSEDISAMTMVIVTVILRGILGYIVLLSEKRMFQKSKGNVK